MPVADAPRLRCAAARFDLAIDEDGWLALPVRNVTVADADGSDHHLADRHHAGVVAAMRTTGFQATAFGRAVDEINRMVREHGWY